MIRQLFAGNRAGHFVHCRITNVNLCHSWTFCSNSRTKIFGSETPVKHNNSQDICTQLQIEIKPPSEGPCPHIVIGGWVQNFPGCLYTILPVSDGV